MSKEYTYDIDKYTIGVDENGEGGIGMTVAKIENGEINVLGNCYGENARCIDLLIKENQELKIQVSAREEVANKYKEVIDKLKELIESKNNGVCVINGKEKEAFTFLLDFDKAREFIWGLLEILKEVE